MAAAAWCSSLAIGTAGGLFSGLFGVGGGVVIVPLLVLWLGYGEREATGTSLGAIAIVAAVGRGGASGCTGTCRSRRACSSGSPRSAASSSARGCSSGCRSARSRCVFALLLVAVAIDLLVPDA